ncbi:MAG: hypothetical protein KAR45_16200, partial [Desulfobacteraceae bacterium]|nr:hypothetical protein [Desulfobacteraceae bacterium]
MENKKLIISISENSSETLFMFKGNLDAEGASETWNKTKTLILNNSYQNVVFDLSEVKTIDSAGASLVLHFEDLILQQSTYENALKFINLDSKHEQTLKLCRKNFTRSNDLIVSKKNDDFITTTGKQTFSLFDELSAATSFTGEILVATFKTIFKPKSFRWSEFFLTFEKAGIDALFIVALIS